jgi:hypothetical protein
MMRKERNKEKLVQNLDRDIAFVEFKRDEKIISSIEDFTHLMSQKIVAISHSKDRRDCQKKKTINRNKQIK